MSADRFASPFGTESLQWATVVMDSMENTLDPGGRGEVRANIFSALMSLCGPELHPGEI